MDKQKFNSMGIDKQVIEFNARLKGSSIRQVCKSIGIPKTTIRDRFTKKGYVYDPENNQYVQSNDSESNKKLTINNEDEEIKSKQKITFYDKDKLEKNEVDINSEKTDETIDNTESKLFITPSNMVEEIESNKKLTNIEVVGYENINRKNEAKKNNLCNTEDEKYLYYKNNIEKIYGEIVELVDLKEDIKALIKKQRIEEHVIELNDVKIDDFKGDLKVKTVKMYEEVLNEFNNFMDGHKELKQQDVISQAVWEFIKKYK